MKEIHLAVRKGELVFVIGKIGSGKTSLISAMLGEMLAVDHDLFQTCKDRVLSDTILQ